MVDREVAQLLATGGSSTQNITASSYLTRFGIFSVFALFFLLQILDDELEDNPIEHPH
jgi:hypothetical protein